MASANDRAIRTIKELGLARPIELEAHGVSRTQLGRLVREGLVERQSRGVYAASGHEPTAQHILAHVAKRVPNGVFCLLTALRFHGLTTQSPAEVWIALPEKARRPHLDYPRVRVARFSGPALTDGIERHRVEGVEIQVYSAQKTVADCFKYRNKLGVDVAIAALRAAIHSGKATSEEIVRAARLCRVQTVIKPYLEAVAP